MVSTYLLIFKSSILFINPLGIVQSAPITIGITVAFVFHRFFFVFVFFVFFQFSSQIYIYLSLFSLSFNFTLWAAGTAKSTIQQVLFGGGGFLKGEINPCQEQWTIAAVGESEGQGNPCQQRDLMMIHWCIRTSVLVILPLYSSTFSWHLL